MSKKLIAYHRVSTQKQGQDGLGMQAQRDAVARYAVSVGGTLLAEYDEVESAAKHNLKKRPQLRAALAHAKRSNAVLVLAKLDRLSRSVEVTSQLLNSGVEFVACDNPHANRMTIQILAVMAEFEAAQISTRTKDAMAAAKARGAVFGGVRNVTAETLNLATRNSVLARAEAAREAYADLVPQLLAMRGNGLTLYAIAQRFNDAGHSTRNGKRWTTSQVSRVLKNYVEA